MAKTNNILPDSRITYLLEVQIANQKRILDELDRINERFDRIERRVGMTEREKNKPASFYNTKEVMEILRVSRNTLLSYRKNGIINPAKPGNKVLYSSDDIKRIKEHKKKTA